MPPLHTNSTRERTPPEQAAAPAASRASPPTPPPPGTTAKAWARRTPQPARRARSGARIAIASCAPWHCQEERPSGNPRPDDGRPATEPTACSSSHPATQVRAAGASPPTPRSPGSTTAQFTSGKSRSRPPTTGCHQASAPRPDLGPIRPGGCRTSTIVRSHPSSAPTKAGRKTAESERVAAPTSREGMRAHAGREERGVGMFRMCCRWYWRCRWHCHRRSRCRSRYRSHCRRVAVRRGRC